jgi:hypothetical protein
MDADVRGIGAYAAVAVAAGAEASPPVAGGVVGEPVGTAEAAGPPQAATTVAMINRAAWRRDMAGIEPQ